MAKSTVKVKFARPITYAGVYYEKGDSAELFPFEKRHLVQSGAVEGKLEDIPSQEEKDANVLKSMQKASERDDVDVWSVDKVAEEMGEQQSSSDEKSSSKK